MYTLYSFHKYRLFFNSNLSSSKVKKKNFFLLITFFLLTNVVKVKIFQKKFLKRTLVLLKSPFHYKIAKHHLSYSFFFCRISAYSTFDEVEQLTKLVGPLSTLFRINRLQQFHVFTLKLGDLIL